MAPLIISVEGNIGSGKSTFVRRMQDEFKDIIFLQEPVDEWANVTDLKGETILSKFYKDQEAYSFSFQMMAYISRLSLLKKTVEENPDSVIVTERCLLTDRFVFAKMLYDEGKIEDINYTIYLKWFDTFYNDYPISKYIYLQTTEYTAFERVKKRSREGETIPIEYLRKCHHYHESWISTMRNTNNVMIINANENEEHMPEWIDAVRKLIEKK
jgi:deoxyguanosine kinase